MGIYDSTQQDFDQHKLWRDRREKNLKVSTNPTPESMPDSTPELVTPLLMPRPTPEPTPFP
jgi:hypothetical protein